MDITLSKADLNRALSVIQSIVAKRTTMPILSNVLLSASGKQLKISATDLEITAVFNAPAQVRSKGSTTVNAKVFGDIVRELPDGELTIKLTEGERVEITSHKSKLRMIGVSADEYPGLPGISFEPKSKIGSQQLLEMINKTIYAVSFDEARFNLNGVCFEIITEGKGKKAESTLRMVATDGHRLSMINRPACGLDFQGRVIVPRKGLSELRKVLSPDEDIPVGIAIEEGFLIVETGDTKISMRLVDGEYPNYEQVIPSTKGSVASLKSSDLSQALRRTALMVTDRGKCVKLDIAKDSLRITSSSPELGDAVEELPVSYSGPALSIGFNALYMLDFATSLGEDQTISLELNGELGAGKLYAEGDQSYLGIVMPMRLT